ncbi:MAG: DUF2059 domain-containing protein [Opitutae bacterium]|nr:DUF2059 domain-containing protein [Opitutae bacterium]
MKLLNLRFALLLLSAVTAFAAEPAVVPTGDAPPEFRGVLIIGTDQRFALSLPNGSRTDWVTVGASFEGWQVVAYRQAEDSLVVKKAGKELTLKLATSHVGQTVAKATIADAEDVMRKMNFDSMLDKILTQQKQASLTMMKRMVSGASGRGAAPEDVAALQQKVMDVMFSQMNAESLRGDFARIYSEVFTKDELRSMGEFYGTPLGQTMIEKQPAMQQKITEVMQSKMVSVMPKIQQMSQEFAQEQKAKREAQAAAKASAPAPTATPAPAATPAATKN